MSISRILSRWRADPQVGGQITTWHSTPARPPSFFDFPANLHPALQVALKAGDIHALYTHQYQAWDQIHSGNNVVIVTGTASGKSLCYQLPVLDSLLQDTDCRALFLFPTKALAQDQLESLRRLWSGLPQNMRDGGIPAAVYDGDTPASQRSSIRKTARIILSNPDMLHTGILPHHAIWAEFFQNLRYIVLDELHIYRGIFGSHVANVLRRLKRITHFYGASPQFILTSATIANPQAHAERMTAEPIHLINQDGSGRGPRHFLFYNPPLVDESLGLRRSALLESVRLADDLLADDIQTVLFGRTRRTVELVLTYLRQQSGPYGDAITDTVRGYRGGYLPNLRREIENGLRSGQVRAVVATNALELGMDIGGMGSAILVGYPGSIAATWQQAGRAGRGREVSAAILVATADPLDQYLCRNPDYFFERSPEQALVNPENTLILLDHLRCAAFELPFIKGEQFGSLPAEQLNEFLDFMILEGVLHTSNERYFWMADSYPAQKVSLRSASSETVVLQVQDEYGGLAVIGQVEANRAAWLVHSGAVYLHEAQSFLVNNLDLENKTARLIAEQSDYYTEPRGNVTVSLVDLTTKLQVTGGWKYQGEIQVTHQIIGFRKLRWYTHELLGFENLDLPPSELLTTGYWLSLSEQTVNDLRLAGLWRNEPNNYGPDWPRLTELVRSRDGFRCQVCGKPEGPRAHDVHHKIPLRAFAQVGASPPYLMANRLENLVTLCSDCHRRAETAVRVRSGLAGLGYALGHIAPLFLMCDPGDLGVHSDPQSPLAEGNPTVLIYDQIPAGIGFSQRLYEIHTELLNGALDLVAGCACSDGCPSCVGPGGENGLGGRQETLAILRSLTSQSAQAPSASAGASDR